MYDVVIIDPASPEFNRGSFCYLPYILYSCLAEEGKDVLLIEDFTLANIDSLPKAETYYVGLWSYPQIDACLTLDRFLPIRPFFFGYNPLIEHYFGSERTRKVSDDEIYDGINSYCYHFDEFKFLLLSDCDMHLKKYDGQVYPLFTAYGCHNNCAFCPVGVNCNRQRVVLPAIEVTNNLWNCRQKGKMNIHFTDEDFFHDTDRAYRILMESNADGAMKFIALGHVNTVMRFIEKYGAECLVNTGMKLIEVGFETASETVAKAMNKPSVSKYIELANLCKGKVDIFWLTLTFFPEETIQSLNETGDFLREYGHKVEDLYGRIATNSTYGGLGQFFQLYDGVKNYRELFTKGRFLSDRPMRLMPSFVPYSFLDSDISFVRPVEEDEKKWYKMYGLTEKDKVEFEVGDTIHETLGNSFVDSPVVDQIRKYIYCAISARLGVIK